MNWALWIRQTLTVMKIELKRYILGKHWIGVYLFAFAPVALFLFMMVIVPARIPSSVITLRYAIFYQTFTLRLAVFLSCALVFSQLFRGEVLEKTLHFYLLAPMRREVLMAGKYLAGVVMMAGIFGVSTLLTNTLLYAHSEWTTFFFEGEGLPNLMRYVLVTVMACIAYGGVFTLMGTLFKNPAAAAILIAGWEAFYFILPASLQSFTIMHYLQSMLPVGIDLGVFAVVANPTPAIIGIPLLTILAGILVWIAGQVVRRTQVTYSAD
jgi:hypothetical protein